MEVILSAGTLETPKILMHSGIGPARELQRFNIPVVIDLAPVGKGLKDHVSVPLAVMRQPYTNDRNSFFGDEAAMAAALREWEGSCTGPWTEHFCQVGCGWFKSDRITTSDEFKELPESVRDFLNRDTVPHYEIATHFPIHFIKPHMFQDFSYICLGLFLMNGQSRGEVCLQSPDPDVPLLFDPKFFEHPYDRRACVEIYRHALELLKTPSFAKDTVSTILAARSDSDEDILDFWKSNLFSAWHMTGTVKMGKPGDTDTAVDNQFRVIGIDNLRVADMSVVPVLTNNHTQATAYATGVTCGEVLSRQYGLNEH